MTCAATLITIIITIMTALRSFKSEAHGAIGKPKIFAFRIFVTNTQSSRVSKDIKPT